MQRCPGQEQNGKSGDNAMAHTMEYQELLKRFDTFETRFHTFETRFHTLETRFIHLKPASIHLKPASINSKPGMLPKNLSGQRLPKSG